MNAMRLIDRHEYVIHRIPHLYAYTHGHEHIYQCLRAVYVCIFEFMVIFHCLMAYKPTGCAKYVARVIDR